MPYLLYNVSINIKLWINAETSANCDLCYIQTEGCSSTIDRYSIICSINRTEQHRMETLELNKTTISRLKKEWENIGNCRLNAENDLWCFALCWHFDDEGSGGSTWKFAAVIPSYIYLSWIWKVKIKYAEVWLL